MSSAPLRVEEKRLESTGDLRDTKNFDHRGTADNGKGFDYRLESDIFANDNNDVDKDGGIELGYLPPDQRPGIPGELLAHLVDPEIDDDTEAGEALRANANVKVGKVGKAARGLNAQSVRRLVKRATLRGNSGNKRGKPPRIPPGITTESSGDFDIEHGDFNEDIDDGQGSLFKVEDLDASIDDVAELASLSSDETSGGGLPAAGRDSHDHQDADSLKLEQRNPDVKSERSSVANGGGIERVSSKQAKEASPGEEAEDIPVEVVAATMETGRKLMGAIDPHNMLQLQRWRRKNRRGNRKTRKSYVKGKVIDGRHELYTLSIAVMLGVRTSIAKTNTIIASTTRANALTAQDFMAEEKYEFAPKGSDITPPHKLSHTFKFKDYAPLAFAYLRRMFGVNEFDFLLSVCGNANFIEFISNAKSGQFFFYSSDGKYMIKTMTNAESKFLRRILPHYFRHCVQNPNTLITKFLGMYRVKLYHLRRNVKFVIMNSVYYTDKSLQIFYDLKGSEIGREAKPGQDVLKDNDLRKILPEQAFSFHPDVRKRVRQQVVSDCSFLSRMQIMDYSMLIGIHHIPPRQGNNRGIHSESGFRASGIKNEPKLPARVSKGQGVDSESAAAASLNGDCKDPSISAPKQGNAESSKGATKEFHEASSKNYEYPLDEDDDCSYLEGSMPSGMKSPSPSGAKIQQHPALVDVELKKEQTIEQIYWPFHRFYDINGLRRMQPRQAADEKGDQLAKAWKIPDFMPPLSNRKDGGLMMDTSGIGGPGIFHGPKGDRPHEGKIFFMGIIDILQQYNARKRVETSYRKMENSEGLEPSCVSPDDYADRFITFFDQYSQTARPKNAKNEEKTEIEATIIDKNMVNAVRIDVKE
ncbi:unnamed protein product [Cylindrotheca closterium]|uniref:PIPK domain-containing protein n=1 Tax=Cylindrotheca closterium TaxID=2856 RepID=A0AAD2CWZ8_9STRA|nr:unnamed protein product [Cylindrotheca closterium]